MLADNYNDELKAQGVTQPAPVYRVYDFNIAAGGPIVKDKLWYFMQRPRAGEPSEHAEHLLQQERGQPELVHSTKPDLSKPAFSDRTWENYTPRITWQISSRNKITGSWDEQPVCRNCTGTTSLTGSPNFVWFASPESDGHGEFSPQRIQQVKWTSPVTSKLLLEAGFGTTYYEWGGKQLEDDLHREPGADAEPQPGDHAHLQHGHALPLAVLVEQQDARLAVQRVRRVHHRFAQHEVRLPGRLLARRSRAARQQSEPRLHRRSRSRACRSSRSRSTQYINPFERERAGHAGVVLRSGQLDDEPPHVAGWAALRPSLELVPGTDDPEAAVLPGRDFRARPTA